MNFVKFRDGVKANLDAMIKENTRLFVVDIDGDELYNFYLDSFPSGTNDIYRTRREHDCSACRRFIKDIGAAVSINGGVVKSVWDFETGDRDTQSVCDAMARLIHSKPIKDVYVARESVVGLESNKEMIDGVVHTWKHFYANVPRAYIVDRYHSTIEGEKAKYRSNMENLKLSLETFTVDDITTLIELIKDGVVYRGDQWTKTLDGYIGMKRDYDVLDDEQKALYVWENAVKGGGYERSLKNTSIGTLLLDIHNDIDLDTALRKYEAVVAPTNYKRPKAVFTKRMLEDAKTTITELGYLNSLRRRHANIDDVTIDNLLYADEDVTRRLTKKSDDLFASMEDKAVKRNPAKKYQNASEITIDKFLSDVVPNASSIELLFEPRLEKNLMSLIAPVDKSAPSMFKWNNPFSWAYKGNVADSVKQNVSKAGGNVDGYLRFSIQWNDTDPTVNSNNDLDAHCKIYKMSSKNKKCLEEIYFGHKTSYCNHGHLDVDMIHTNIGVPAVENIYWKSKDDINDYTFEFFVHQYTYRGGNDGFRAQLEINGEIFDYDYKQTLRQGDRVKVVTVSVNKDGKYKITHKLDSSSVSRKIWGINTNEFVPVSSIMLSPNYWGDNHIGNKHYIFGIGGCINEEKPNAWYNEFLKDELVKHHKRVMEALASQARVEDAPDQISGFGFSSTLHEKFTVRVKGATDRIMNVVI